MKNIKDRLQQLASPGTAEILQKFFKTGPGEYGEGDIFIGVRVPDLRKLAKEFQDITTSEVLAFLASSIHEERFLALLILVRNYGRGDEIEKKKIYDLYLENTSYINSWDLVDGSAHHIVGAFLMDKNKAPLYRLAKSENLWERRIAMVSTFYFIKHNQFQETLEIAKILLTDPEDLIHKAVGWMLREIGKRDVAAEETFLKKHSMKMPRTMLRYAIEKFPEPKRQRYLKGNIRYPLKSKK
jgi:3-methyladenine DNA glycosylase AlkD